MSVISFTISLLTLAIWLYLWLRHAAFWRIERNAPPAEPDCLPSLVVIIPARNEEATLPETLRSLWRQNYPGTFRIVVVDDHSEDRTAKIARQIAQEMGREDDLTLLTAEPLPPDWTGKVWAMQQGWTRGVPADDPARYILFSDADIVHGQDALRELASRAEADRLDLVSFMVRLRCENTAERLMIPAFVFFFRMLYPFRRINNPADRLAGAAGGAMLARREALDRMEGLTRIRRALIDDCALAQEIKRSGHRIWIGLSETSFSSRRYETLRDILQMIARCAYAQLNNSPMRLAACVAGLFLTFLAPPLLLGLASGEAAILGGLTWLLMSLLYLPMVRFYRQSPLWSSLLPLTALLYLWATILSGWRYHRRQGGQWKGRRYAPFDS
jgi:hopene-associated glycosyltransferase HpnB